MRSAQMSEQISISAFDRKAIDIVPLCSYHLQRPANKSQRLRASKSCNLVQIENHMKIHGSDRSFLSLPFWNFVALDDSGNSPCTRPAWMATPFPRNWLRCSSSSPEIANVFATKEVAVRARSAESHGQIRCFLPQCWREKNKNQVIKLYGRLFSSIWNFQPDSFRSWHGEFSDAYGLWWASLNAPLTVEIPPQWFCDAFGWQYGFHTHALIEHVLPTFLLPEVAQGIFNASSPYPGLPQPRLTLTNGRTVPATAATHDMLLWSRPRLSVSRVCRVWSFCPKAKSVSSSQIASILQAQCPSQIGPG